MAVFDEQHVSATTCSGSPAHGFVPRGVVFVSNQIGMVVFDEQYASAGCLLTVLCPEEPFP